MIDKTKMAAGHSRCKFTGELLALAPRRAARLLMPRLGEPVEPDRVAGPTPWWRAVDQGAEPVEPASQTPPESLLLPGEPID